MANSHKPLHTILLPNSKYQPLNRDTFSQLSSQEQRNKDFHKQFLKSLLSYKNCLIQSRQFLHFCYHPIANFQALNLDGKFLVCVNTLLLKVFIKRTCKILCLEVFSFLLYSQIVHLHLHIPLSKIVIC